MERLGRSYKLAFHPYALIYQFTSELSGRVSRTSFRTRIILCNQDSPIAVMAGGFKRTGSDFIHISVFDDGDEKTLRRTSLCLKGERHFAESEVSLGPACILPPVSPGQLVFRGFFIFHRLWISCRSPTQNTLGPQSLAKRPTAEAGAPHRLCECCHTDQLTDVNKTGA